MTNNKGGEARKHHYVPQCYLKGFTHNGSRQSRLYVVDARERRAFQTTPLKIAAERDFNRIDGDEPNAIEAIYSDFEAKAGPALVRTDARGTFASDEDLAVILELVALLAVRNPRRREHTRKFYEHSSRVMMDLLVADKERWEAREQRAIAGGFMEPSIITYEEAKEFVERGEYRVDVATTRHVELELKLLPTVYDLLQRRTWVVLRAAPGSGGFVTSDNPATLCWDDEKLADGFYPPGFASTDTSVVCPLSKNVAIRGCFDGRSGAIEAPANIVAAINTRTIAYSDRQVYAESDQFRFVAPDGAVLHGHALLSIVPPEMQSAEPASPPS